MRDIPTSPRIAEIKKKSRKKKIRLTILIVVLLGGLVFGLSVLSRNKHIVINEIRVTGAHVIDEEEVKAEINQRISGKYVYLFSKANSFIYPNREIYNSLRELFPRIESLSINLENLKILNINITERKGEFLYCGESVPVEKNEVGENCYFINNDGYIFDQAPYFSGNVYFKYYMVIPDNEKSSLGKQMIHPDKFHTIVRFVDGIEALGFDPIYFLMSKNNETNYLYLNHKEGNLAPSIIFKDTDNFDDILENFSLAMKKKEFAEEIHSRYNTLLYIDMRFKNKMSYKFQ